MKRSSRRWLAVLLASLGCACGARPQALQQAGSPKELAVRPLRTREPVVVVVIVDQFAAWVVQERLDTLPADGGFARLRREGWYAPELRYEHATTSTAPGHAALFTGLPPRGSGIFTNELPGPQGHLSSILADEGARSVVNGRADSSSSSAKRVRVETLADALRRERPNATIVALSLKDRGAIFGGGQKPDASLWYDRAHGRLMTSTAFAEALPVWVRAANQELSQIIPRTVWRPLDASWIAAHATTPDDAPGEGDLGLGTSFPHDLSRAEQPASLFRVTPNADEFLVRLAVRALDAYAERSGPRFLALSLSAFDYVGHVFGPDSWESWDALRRVDRALAELLSALDQRFQGEFSLLLTADHGSATMPETLGNERARPWCKSDKPDPYERPCAASGRLHRDALTQLLEGAARTVLGPGRWIADVAEPYVYFTPEARALDAKRRGALEAACVAALEKMPEIAQVWLKERFPSACPDASDDSLEALVCRSLSEDAGELYILTKPGSFFDPELDRGRGSNHGTPYLYDRTVPLFVRTATRAHAGEIVTSRLRPADFTRTGAALLGIRPPQGALQGRDVNACSECFDR